MGAVLVPMRVDDLSSGASSTEQAQQVAHAAIATCLQHHLQACYFKIEGEPVSQRDVPCRPAGRSPQPPAAPQPPAQPPGYCGAGGAGGVGANDDDDGVHAATVNAVAAVLDVLAHSSQPCLRCVPLLVQAGWDVGTCEPGRVARRGRGLRAVACNVQGLAWCFKCFDRSTFVAVPALLVRVASTHTRVVRTCTCTQRANKGPHPTHACTTTSSKSALARALLAPLCIRCWAPLAVGRWPNAMC